MDSTNKDEYWENEEKELWIEVPYWLQLLRKWRRGETDESDAAPLSGQSI